VITRAVAAVEAAAPAHFAAVERHFGAALDEDDAEALLRVSDKLLHTMGEECAWLLRDVHAAAAP
jgi:hypothetical protein